MLRKLHGAEFEKGRWRIRSNNGIEQMLEKENIVRYDGAGRIRWLGHVQRMNEKNTYMNNACKNRRNKKSRP